MLGLNPAEFIPEGTEDYGNDSVTLEKLIEINDHFWQNANSGFPINKSALFNSNENWIWHKTLFSKLLKSASFYFLQISESSCAKCKYLELAIIPNLRLLSKNSMIQNKSE